MRSYSLTATLECDQDLLEWTCSPPPASSEQDPLISTKSILPTAPGTAATSGTIYGKVVKSIQRSIRKIFHCGRENGLAPPPRQPGEEEGEGGEERESERPVEERDEALMTAHSAASGQSDIPMSLIRHSAVSSSPITSVSSADPAPLMIPPIHKTLLIDVAYGVCRNDNHQAFGDLLTHLLGP